MNQGINIQSTKNKKNIYGQDDEITVVDRQAAPKVKSEIFSLQDSSGEIFLNGSSDQVIYSGCSVIAESSLWENSTSSVDISNGNINVQDINKGLHNERISISNFVNPPESNDAV